MSQPLCLCHVCQLTSRITDKPMRGSELLCPRCEAPLHLRKPHSLERTWAFLIVSLIFYIPANFLPITKTSYIGGVQSDTIMSGVIYFVQTGSWHVALIIFVASVLVPVVKIVILSYLLFTVQRGSSSRLVDRTRFYRITRSIGRWSMVDIFVVAILVALVQLGPVAEIEAGPGAIYFGGVVVFTMLAADAFDPRLIWDRKGEK
jgi:paraquat-inducible protein A